MVSFHYLFLFIFILYHEPKVVINFFFQLKLSSFIYLFFYSKLLPLFVIIFSVVLSLTWCYFLSHISTFIPLNLFFSYLHVNYNTCATFLHICSCFLFFISFGFCVICRFLLFFFFKLLMVLEFIVPCWILCRCWRTTLFCFSWYEFFVYVQTFLIPFVLMFFHLNLFYFETLHHHFSMLHILLCNLVFFLI